jgi:hypothetical protein
MLAGVGLSWDNESSAANAAILGSMGLIVVSSIWDMATASRSARKYNEKKRLSISPTYDYENKTKGLQLAFSF